MYKLESEPISPMGAWLTWDRVTSLSPVAWLASAAGTASVDVEQGYKEGIQEGRSAAGSIGKGLGEGLGSFGAGIGAGIGGGLKNAITILALLGVGYLGIKYLTARTAARAARPL